MCALVRETDTHTHTYIKIDRLKDTERGGKGGEKRRGRISEHRREDKLKVGWKIYGTSIRKGMD